MERLDLRGSYGGWQAVDATPQEPSPHSPVFTLGPAPVAAVKEGKNMKYDVEFVVSEVNADEKEYLQQRDGSFKLVYSNTYSVGKNISTKSVGSQDRNDITLTCKYKEGTLAERIALEGGNNLPPTDMFIDIVPASNVLIGQALKADIVVKSTASAQRTVDYVVKIRPVTYAGSLGPLLKEISDHTSVAPNATVTVPVTVMPEDYITKVKDQLLVQIQVFATVRETEATFIDTDTFRFRTPDIDVVLVGGGNTMRVGQTSQVKASFRNPLNLSLSNVRWYIEGSGLTDPKVFTGRTVAPGGMAEAIFDIVPKNAIEPTRTLTVSFESNILETIMGQGTFNVVQ